MGGPAENGSGPQEIRYDASGMRFAALAWGKETDPLALLLHGFPDTAWTWRHLGPYLADRGWRAVAPFTRGYAPTDLAPDGGYDIGALALDAAEAHRALGGDERAVLVGHDWGAITAYTVGSWRPELFRRIVTIAVAPLSVFFEPILNPSRLPASLGTMAAQTRMSWYLFFQQLPGISERRLPRVIEKLWADWSPGYDAREDLAHVADALRGPGRRTAALRYYRAFAQPWYRSRAYADPQSHIYGVPEVPTLYLHGRTDGCLHTAHAERTLEHRAEVLAPGSEAEILDGVGHFLQLEDPTRVNPRIADFVEAGVRVPS